MQRIMPVAGLAAAVLLVSTDQAFAYLDPGVGSMLLQGLIAGIAAISVAGGYYWSKIKSLFSSAEPQKRPAPDHDPQ